MSQKWRKEGGGKPGGERERFVFMLVVTEVFIAPPTHTERERGMGERGCIVQKESKREEDDRGVERNDDREAERQIRGTAGGRYY